MRSERKQTSVIADKYEIITSQQYSGYRIDREMELLIRDQIEYDKHNQFIPDEDFEFYKRLITSPGQVEGDPRTGKVHLYTFQVWYVYHLKVRYTYDKQSYETLVRYETEKSCLSTICKLDITFYRDAPQHVLHVAEHPKPVWAYIADWTRKLLHRKTQKSDGFNHQ